VAFHDRINRTAELVGVKLPQSRSKNKRFGYDTSSESDSLFDSDNSDSDESSIQSFRYSDKTQMNESSTTERIDPPSFKRGAPPPPPANWPSGIPMGPRHTPPWQVPNCIPTPPTVATPPEIVVNPVGYDLNYTLPLANLKDKSSIILGKQTCIAERHAERQLSHVYTSGNGVTDIGCPHR
jgi:hypothetical protein